MPGVICAEARTTLFAGRGRSLGVAHIPEFGAELGDLVRKQVDLFLERLNAHVARRRSGPLRRSFLSKRG